LIDIQGLIYSSVSLVSTLPYAPLFYDSINLFQIWVYGNSFESCLVAVVNPNQQVLEHWAEQHGITGNFAELCKNSRAKEHILTELTKIAKEKKLKGFEFIKAIHLDPLPFDIERDLITPTYKKKRPQMLKYYQGEIDALYKGLK
jgi:long-chain acyl-CoA synthetase